MFNQDINFQLSNTITHLFFGKNFCSNTRHSIPSSVTHLEFKNNSIHTKIKTYNLQIKNLIYSMFIDKKIIELII
jgi:hypothetical protein